MCMHRPALMEAINYAGSAVYACWLCALWSWRTDHVGCIQIWETFCIAANIKPELCIKYCPWFYFLNEPITILKMIGVIAIMGGVVFIAGGDKE